MNLSSLLANLHKHGQRATYGAVAGVVGGAPRSVMHGQLKAPENCWVVAKKDGKPTGYSLDEYDRRLLSSPKPIETPQALIEWLRNHPVL
jgi:hypothetical protein